MSYTKMQNEIEKLLKSRHNFDSDRLIAYRQARDIIFERWLEAKRYKELISVAHAGWFSESDFLEPLADYFIRADELGYLRFLCERKIRFDIEDLLYKIKYYAAEIKGEEIEEIFAVKISHHIKDSIISYDQDKKLKEPVWEIVKQRYWALWRIERYINYLEKFDATELLKQVNAVRQKIIELTIKKKDLNILNYKLSAT